MHRPIFALKGRWHPSAALSGRKRWTDALPDDESSGSMPPPFQGGKAIDQ